MVFGKGKSNHTLARCELFYQLEDCYMFEFPMQRSRGILVLLHTATPTGRLEASYAYKLLDDRKADIHELQVRKTKKHFD